MRWSEVLVKNGLTSIRVLIHEFGGCERNVRVALTSLALSTCIHNSTDAQIEV